MIKSYTAAGYTNRRDSLFDWCFLRIISVLYKRCIQVSTSTLNLLTAIFVKIGKFIYAKPLPLILFRQRRSKANKYRGGIMTTFKRTCIRINNSFEYHSSSFFLSLSLSLSFSLFLSLSLSDFTFAMVSYARQILLGRSSEFVRTIMQIHRHPGLVCMLGCGLA